MNNKNNFITSRTDFTFKFHFSYFNKNSKFKQIDMFSNSVKYLPYELNGKFPNFALQTNEYLQASYFVENTSYIDMMSDSSFEEGCDTGKKLTAMFFLFPDDLKLNKRKLNLKIKNMSSNNEDVFNVCVKQPLSCVMIKARKISYQIERQNFPFVVVFYYMHGPADRKEYTC